MKCPFRVGISFEYNYIGKNTKEDKADSSKYIEVAQHSVFEDCYEDECPYYLSYNGSCERIAEYD